MPRLAPGVRVLQSTYGHLPWTQVVTPAENLARFGHPLSQALAVHLRDAGPLMNDAAALATFMNANRQILRAGETLTQPALAEAFAAVRTRAAEESDIPTWRNAAVIDRAAQRGFVLTPAAAKPNTAATSFIVGDEAGNVVACVLTLGRLFGAGRIRPGEGYLQADAAAVHEAALDANITLDRASGRLRSARAAGAFTNTLDCAAQNELGTETCEAATDARGAGLAVMLTKDR